MVNALGMRLQPFDLGQGADISNALAPIQRGMDQYRAGQDKAFEGQRMLNQERLQQRKFDLELEDHEYKRRKQTIEEIGNLATAADTEKDPAKRAQIHQMVLQRHPNAANLPPIYRDPMVGPRLLMAEAGKARNDLDEQEKRARINMTKAQATYYRNRTAALTQPQPAAAPAQPAPDPLAGMGMDEEGRIVGGQATQAPAAPSYGPGQGDTWQLERGPLPPPMRLGGPMDDVDRSMRLDEGGQQPVRMAQATTGGVPSQMDQARARMYGPAGITSPEIPGIVTDAGRNRRLDPAATREFQGQRAVDAAPSAEQERLRRFREDQERWGWVYKRQPRGGYYYGPDGRELALSDKNYKGDKEMQAQAMLNMQKIDQASKVLLDTNIATQAVAGYFNLGQTGQALADMKQAALGIAYSLSGKTVAVAEMKNFIDAYGPTPFDTNERIRAKVQRMNQFYGALIAATRGGEDYDKAFARAMAVMGVKNPDGTPVGQPAAASAGRTAAPDLSGVPTEELVRRLQGAR